MMVGPNGWSPEQGPTEDGVSCVQEIVFELFSNTIAAADVLGIDPAFRATLADRHSRLLVPGIGSWGQVMEWTTEQPALEHSDHRHTSHLHVRRRAHGIRREILKNTRLTGISHGRRAAPATAAAGPAADDRGCGVGRAHQSP